MKRPALSFHRKHVHVALLTGLLLVVGVLAQKYRPGFSSASSEVLEITCSTQRETNPCGNARHGVRGDWISNSENAKQINEDKKSAWVQYTSKETVLFTGATLINRAGAHNDILDGHFEFGGGRRYPAEGGIGPLENLTEPLIEFPKPFKSKTIKFVVDKVSAGTADAGLSLFLPFWSTIEAKPVERDTGVILAITIISDGSDITIEQIKAINADPPFIPNSGSGLYRIDAVDDSGEQLSSTSFTPQFRDIIVEFTDDKPKVSSVFNDASRQTLYLPFQSSVKQVQVTNMITNTIEDTKVISQDLLDSILRKNQDENKPIIIPFLEKVKDLLKQ